MPRAFARSADMTTAAAAPSDICDELPAGDSLHMKGRLERGQRFERCVGAGAFVHLEDDLRALRLDPLGVVKLTGTGTVSSSNLPASMAANAFLWLSRRTRRMLAGDVEALRDALGGQSHRRYESG